MTAFARQSTCVAISGRAVLIEGAPGVGKTSLALALIDRGAQLVGDDSVLLERRDGRLIATPHPATKGLVEVRNLGLLPFPSIDRAPVALVLTLAECAPRYIEAPNEKEIGGILLPAISLHRGSATLPLKAELALAHYGLAPPRALVP